jgi:hypothetical protein
VRHRRSKRLLEKAQKASPVTNPLAFEPMLETEVVPEG